MLNIDYIAVIAAENILSFEGLALTTRYRMWY
jgi:hypothetical protein